MKKNISIVFLFVFALCIKSKSQLTVPVSNGEGITIGNPNDAMYDPINHPMDRIPGLYAIKFYGYRDIRNNIITSKITSERTNLCCSAANGGPYLDQGSDLAFYTTNVSDNAYADNSLERLRIKDNGDVGIGTSSPLAKLHIEGPGGGKILMGSNNGTYGLMSLNGTFWDWNMISSSVDRNLYFNRTAGADIWFRMGGGTDQMVLKLTGNLGIGTPTPEARLTVSGASVGGTNSQSNISSFTGNGLRINSTGGVYSQDAITYQSGLNGGGAGIAFGRYGAYDTYISFYTNPYNNAGAGNISEGMRLDDKGNLGIGTIDTKGYKLAVKGAGIFTKVQVKADAVSWPDYVFHKSYNLRSLSSLETYIQENNHLPDVPSDKEVEANGVDLGATQAALLKKIEELTLYVIAQGKEIEKLKLKIK